MEMELLFEMTAMVAPPIAIADIPAGSRVIVHVTGGKFEGPRMRGTVLASGADWFLVRSGSLAELDVRIVLRTDDGENIYMTYRGRAKMDGRGAIESLRTAPTFEASTKGKYGWLNAVQALGVGGPPTMTNGVPSAVTYKIYTVE